MDMTREDLEALVLCFRRAAERVGENKEFGRLEGFPDGRCQDASRILAWILAERTDAESVEYVWGNGTGDNAGWTHGWLVVDGTNIDVTADQFANGPAGVIIAGPNPFHDTFALVGEGTPYPIPWHALKGRVGQQYREAYEAVVAEMARLREGCD